MILEATYWLNSLTQGFIYIFCWNQLFPHRVKHTYLIGALNIPTLNILIMFCYRRAWLSYLALNILKMFSSIPALFILYKGSVRKKIWIFIATELISLLCTLPLEALLSFLYHAPIDQIVANKNDTIGGTILLNSILMGIGIIVGLLYNRKKHVSSIQFTQSLIMLCFVIVHFVFSCVQFTNRAVLQRDLNCLVHSAFQIMLFIVIYIQYVTTLRNWELSWQAQDLEHIRLQQDYTYNYYLLAEQRFQDVTLLRQDMQNLMNTVQGLNTESALRTFTIAEETTTTEQHFCSIPVIDAVLRLKAQTAAQYDIHTEFCAQGLAESLPFSDSDLCSIFANLLDNAIHSCCNDSNLTDHSIQLYSVTEKDCFILTVTNSYGWDDFPHEITKLDDTGIIGHGHGTKIVKSITQKYRGSFTLQHDRKTVTANLRLPIPIKEEVASHV